MGRPRWLNDEEMRAWQAFLAAGALLDRHLEHQLKAEADISHPQYEVLVRLSAAPDGEMRMSELADALVNSKSSLSYQVTRLEQRGLVRRRSCDTDERAIYACLTDDGRTLLERTAPGHVALVRELLIDALSPTELTAVADGLGKAVQRMSERQRTH